MNFDLQKSLKFHDLNDARGVMDSGTSDEDLMSTLNANVSRAAVSEPRSVDAEVELLRHAREGDPAASEHLFLQYLKGSKSIGGFLRRALSNQEDREEMLHEIFMRLMTGHNSFRGEARLSTYIYQVARITLLQKFRRENTLKRGGLYRTISEPADLADNGQSSPEYVYSLKQLREILNNLIDKLPEAYRKAVRLRVLNELSYEEIAEKMQLPLPTVSTKIHKGKKILTDSIRTLTDLSGSILS